MWGIWEKVQKLLEALLESKNPKGIVTFKKMSDNYLDNYNVWNTVLEIIRTSGMKVQIIPGGYLCKHVLRRMHYLDIPVHHTDGSVYPIPPFNNIEDIIEILEGRILKIYLTVGNMDTKYYDARDKWDKVLNILKKSGMKVQIVPPGYICESVLIRMFYMGIHVYNSDGSDYPIPPFKYIQDIFEVLKSGKIKGYLHIENIITNYLSDPDLWDKVLDILKKSAISIMMIPGGHLCVHVLRHMHYLGIPVHNSDGSDYPIPSLNWNDFTFHEWKILSIYYENVEKGVNDRKIALIFRYILKMRDTNNKLEKLTYLVFMELVRIFVVPELHSLFQFLPEHKHQEVYHWEEGKSLSHLVPYVIKGVKSSPTRCVFEDDYMVTKYRNKLEMFVFNITTLLSNVKDYVSNYCELLDCEITDNFINRFMDNKDTVFFYRLRDLIPLDADSRKAELKADRKAKMKAEMTSEFYQRKAEMKAERRRARRK